MLNSIQTKHGAISLPAFMPDATYGSIKAISFNDAKKAGVDQIVTTTLHIEQKIGSVYIKNIGGVHKFFGWDRPILSDSGGWQVFSLINSARTNQNKEERIKNKVSKSESGKKKGKRKENFITELGCSFYDEETGAYSLLTPESSMTIQMNLGADIVTVLDDPILANASLSERKESVRLNTLWAKRSKKHFLKILGIDQLSDLKNYTETSRPLIGCVIQGADDFDLRKQSANELLEIDFDLFNFGGVPLKDKTTWREDGKEGFYHEMLHYVSELIPNNKIKYAMGVGQPEDIAYCVSVGWNLFDTVLPTRNARHGYLYVSEGQGDKTKRAKTKKLKNSNMAYDVMHIRTERYKFDEKPVDENCDCECCRSVSRSYLRHLIRIGEASGLRLATIHNLEFYSRWMEMLRAN
jgi:queuine tRNA-ribosyltransferase